MIYNVKNHGAAGDGVTPDQGVIQALIDSLPASGGVIYFPTGDYLIEDISAGIEITKNNIEFRGDGPSSKIFRESPSPLANDKYLFYTPYNVMRRNLKFSNLLLNNGQIEDPNPSIMRLHAIDIRGCQGLNVEGLTIQNCGGDGIHISRSGEISNSEPLSSQHIIIRGCILESIYRIGISMTHSCSNITISGCTFKDIDDFSIKMEPGSTGTDSPELNAGLVVSHCMFEIPSSSDFSSKSIGIIGNSYFHPRQASILHNIVHHGEIQIHHAEDVLIAHNTIHERVAPPMSAENATTIFIEGNTKNIIIEDNTLNFSVNGGIALKQGVPGLNEYIVIANNLIRYVERGQTLTPGHGILIEHGSDVVVTGNLVRGLPGDPDAALNATGIEVAPTHADVVGLVVSNNVVAGFTRGIRLNPGVSRKVEQALVAHNILDDCETVGVELLAPERLVRLGLLGQMVGRLGTGAESLNIGSAAGTWTLLLAGVLGRVAASPAAADGVGLLMGQGAPDDSGQPDLVQLAPVGSLFIDAPLGSTSGGRLFVREPGGWVSV